MRDSGEQLWDEIGNIDSLEAKDNEIDRLRNELLDSVSLSEKLKKMVEEAYREGWNRSVEGPSKGSGWLEHGWERSDVRKRVIALS